MKRLLTIAACVLMLTACKERQGQNSYSDGEVGVSRAVEFGTILNVREVDIIPKTSGAGALLGAGAGAGGGSYIGKGDGNAWATVGAAIVGAVAGHYAEQAMNERKGLEYVVQLQSGEAKTIVQEKHDGEAVLKEGSHVMIQYCDSGEKSRKCKDSQYQRLLPVKKLPTYAKKRRKSSDQDVAPAEF